MPGSCANKSRHSLQTVFFQLTSACNLRCLYCYAHQEHPKRLPSERVREILAALAGHAGCTVIFSGGEPTLEPGLADYLEFGAARGLKTGIATNGLHLPQNLLETIQEHGTFVQVSLDAASRSTFEALCGRDRLKEVIGNLRRLVAAGVEATLSFTVTTRNLAELAAVVRLALDEGITHLHVGTLVSSGRASCHKGLGGVGFKTLWDLLFPLQLAHYEQIGIDLVEEFLLPYATGGERRVFCASMAGRAMEITSAGTVTACGMMPAADFRYGNLNEQRFADVLAAFHESGREPCFDFSRLLECRKCEVRSICGGGCRALAYWHSGDPYGTYPHCEEKRRIFREVEAEHREGRLAGYLAFLASLPSEQEESSRYF